MIDAPDWFREARALRFEDRSVEVEGCPIHYVTWGTPGRPGLVLVHGGAAHAHWWSFIAPQLSHDYQVVALDLSGHGDSGRRDGYPRDLWADEVMAVAEHAGLVGAPILVGHSMGGFVCIAAAARYGDRAGIGAVALVESSRWIPARHPGGPRLQRWGFHSDSRIEGESIRRPDGTGGPGDGHPCFPATASATVGSSPTGRRIPRHARSRRPAPRGRDPGGEPVLRRLGKRRIASHRRVAIHVLTAVRLSPMGLRRLLLLGGASFLVGSGPRRMARLLLFAGMAILGAWAVRFFTGFAITAALVTMLNLRDAKRIRLPTGWTSRIAVPHASATACLCLVMSAMGVATWESRAQYELGQSKGHFFSLSPRTTCPGAADYMLDRALPGPIFNEMGWAAI